MLTLRRPPVDALVARTWWVFAAWLGGLSTLHAAIWAGWGWVWFPEGARLLFSSSWSHLYAAHSELQIGPLTFVAVAPIVFALPGALAEVVAVVLMAVCGLVVLAQIRALVPDRSPASDRSFLIGGICFLTLWAEVAVTYAHADDVLAITLTACALPRLHTRRPYLAALLLGLAVDCKPWAVMFVPLLLVIERRRRLRAAAVWAGAVLAAWLPFYLADHRTWSAATFRIPNNAASSLRVFGVHAPSTPAWDRPLQMLLACALAVVLVRRGRWSAVLVVTVAVRILLDPGIVSYYDAGLLAGAVVADLVLLGDAVPVLSLSAVVTFYLPMFALHGHPHTFGVMRTAYLLVVICALTFLPDVGSISSPRRRKYSPRQNAHRSAVALLPGVEVPGGQELGGRGRTGREQRLLRRRAQCEVGRADP